MSLEITTAGESQNKSSKNQCLELVRQKVDSLKFGVIQITVHDSRVVQIEHTEKVRLNRPPEKVETWG